MCSLNSNITKKRTKGGGVARATPTNRRARNEKAPQRASLEEEPARKTSSLSYPQADGN